MARRHREKQPTEWGLYRSLDPHASVPMTLIKLRIKGAATCSVLATWRVAYSLSALLVVLPTDTLAISLSLLHFLIHCSIFNPFQGNVLHQDSNDGNHHHTSFLFYAFPSTNGATRSPSSLSLLPCAFSLLHPSSLNRLKKQNGEREQRRVNLTLLSPLSSSIC